MTNYIEENVNERKVTFMIPKKIHYCWFGRGEKPKLAKKCIDSWKRHCPDYELIEWNEDNFDVNINSYTKMCYEQKKYAFLTDYVRLWVVEKYGGVYFDTDVQVLKSFDELLESSSFFGFETGEYVNTGIGFGAIAGNEIVRQMIYEYDQMLNTKIEFINCPRLNTDALIRFGLKLNGQKQNINNAIIYPIDYFNPLDSITGKLVKTENTYSIHWYSMSWLTPMKRLRSKITRPLHRIFGKDCFHIIRKERESK